jgi:hypothetical protein
MLKIGWLEVKHLELPKTYTRNQTAAIAIQWGTALWALTTAGASLLYLPSSFFSGIGLFWVIGSILSWIWVPLMVMRVRIVFLLSLVHWIVLYIGHIIIMTVIFQAPGWWSFAKPLYYSSFLVAWLAGLLAIYVNYKSYQELK